MTNTTMINYSTRDFATKEQLELYHLAGQTLQHLLLLPTLTAMMFGYKLSLAERMLLAILVVETCILTWVMLEQVAVELPVILIFISMELLSLLV